MIDLFDSTGSMCRLEDHPKDNGIKFVRERETYILVKREGKATSNIFYKEFRKYCSFTAMGWEGEHKLVYFEENNCKTSQNILVQLTRVDFVTVAKWTHLFQSGYMQRTKRNSLNWKLQINNTAEEVF